MTSPEPETVKPSILIVDDDDGVTMTFAQTLTLEGYHVRTAPNAEAGLRAARSRRPDAIILDLRMPLVDGLGFLRQLRSAEGFRAVPVTIVTGDFLLDEGVSAELVALGASLKFKPLWLEDLIGVARDMLAPKVTH